MRYIHGRKARLVDPMLVRITHDMVANVLLGKFASPYCDHGNERLKHYVEVLCWILGHNKPNQPGGVFQKRMDELALHVLASAGLLPSPWPEEGPEEEPVPPERVN